MKRFTETTKWADPWYRRLSAGSKLLWGYLTDNCNSIGLIELDFESAEFHIGLEIEEKHLAELGDRIQRLPNGKIFIPKFIGFQYGVLSDSCPAHKPVIKLANLHGIQISDIGYQYPNARVAVGMAIPTGKERKGKEPERNGKEPTLFEVDKQKPDPTQLRLGALFHRRPTTRWSVDEMKAYRKVYPVDEHDLKILEDYYTAKIPKDSNYRRHDLITLLNNFNGELDRARKHRPETPF